MRTIVVPNTGSTNGRCSAGGGTSGTLRTSCPAPAGAAAAIIGTSVNSRRSRVVLAAATTASAASVAAATTATTRFVGLPISTSLVRLPAQVDPLVPVHPGPAREEPLDPRPGGPPELL